MAPGASVEFVVNPLLDYNVSLLTGCPGELTGNRFVTAPLLTPCTLQVNFTFAGDVDIPDVNLKASIRSALGVAADSPVGPGHLASLQQLDASNRNILSLVGLEGAKNLQRLVLAGNQIADVAPLHGLTGLKYLDLSRNPLSDLSALARLSLESLSFDRSSVASLAFLEGAGDLRYLSLSDTFVNDLASLLSTGLQAASTVSLGSGDALCLNTQGYSRPLLDMANLRSRGVQVDFTDAGQRRQNCADTLANASLQLKAQQTTSSLLDVNWSITPAAPYGAPWRCELHGDLTLQLPAEPLVRLSSCDLAAEIPTNWASGWV